MLDVGGEVVAPSCRFGHSCVFVARCHPPTTGPLPHMCKDCVQSALYIRNHGRWVDASANDSCIYNYSLDNCLASTRRPRALAIGHNKSAVVCTVHARAAAWSLRPTVQVCHSGYCGCASYVGIIKYSVRAEAPLLPRWAGTLCYVDPSICFRSSLFRQAMHASTSGEFRRLHRTALLSAGTCALYSCFSCWYM
jgi:hypothetical protein